MFFIGVLLSQGFSKIITHNNQFSSGLNRWGNILLVRDKPIDLGEYELSYQGSFVKTESDETIDKQTITPTNRQNIIRAKNQIKLKDKTLEVGEEMNVDVQNTFYSIHFKSATQEFDICPRVQANSKMGIIASPDINIHWDGDIYTHVSNFPDPNKSTLDWSNAQAISLKKNDVIFIGNKTIELIALDKQDSYNKQISQAQIKVSLPDTNYLVSCSLILSNDEYQVIPAEIPQLGFHLVMGKADIENNTVGIYTLSQPKDWITVKSMFFPFMYLVWIGGVSMIVGSFFSAFSWYKSSIKLDFIIQWFKNKLWSKETPALNVIK